MEEEKNVPILEAMPIYNDLGHIESFRIKYLRETPEWEIQRLNELFKVI